MPLTPSPTFNLTSKLAATTGPVKNAVDAKVYLEQRSLITFEDNFGLNTLVNLLLMTSLNPKIPNQPTNVIRAVSLLMVSELQASYAREISAAITEKLYNPTTQVLN